MGKRVVDVMGSTAGEEEAEAERSARRAPKGHFVVYVGDQMKRYVVPMPFLRNPRFKQLLDMAAQEYGFDHHSQGNRILLPCDESSFENLLASLTNDGN